MNQEYELNDLQEWADTLRALEPAGFEGLGCTLAKYADSWRREMQDLQIRLWAAMDQIRVREVELAEARAALDECPVAWFKPLLQEDCEKWLKKYAALLTAVREAGDDAA